jgi:hypothetical protein
MYKFSEEKQSWSTLFWANKVRNRSGNHQVRKFDRLAIKPLSNHQINSQSAKLPEKEIQSKKIIPANTRPENQLFSHKMWKKSQFWSEK